MDGWAPSLPITHAIPLKKHFLTYFPSHKDYPEATVTMPSLWVYDTRFIFCPKPGLYRAFRITHAVPLGNPLLPFIPGLSRGNNRENTRQQGEAIAEGPVTGPGPPPRTRRGPGDDHSLRKRGVAPPPLPPRPPGAVAAAAAAATAEAVASCLGKRGAALLPSAVDKRKYGRKISARGNCCGYI